MKKIVINGSKELTGTINISGAKNSVVALIPASILTSEKVEILNVPKLSDTENLQKIINLLGGEIEFGQGHLLIDCANLKNVLIPEEFSNKLRASYYFMGSLLARFHHVEMYFPGGCKIGKRPIDLHIKAFEAMGAKVDRDTTTDKYTIDAPNLHGANIKLEKVSVGATVNIMLAASLADGITTIENAAKEPEIINIADLLNKMGAKISGAGTDKVTIEGVKELHGATIETISDRIETGTYLMIGALTGKDLVINNIIPEHVNALVEKLREAGVDLKVDEKSITVNKAEHFNNIDVTTAVYPGFPTDLGQPMAVILTQTDGVSNFEETIYESRIGHYPELNKMGANIEYENTKARIPGPTELVGCEVTATDLRAGAALIIAGLIAKGTTKISNIEHILRGYEDIVNKLAKVGADITIVDEEENA